MSAEFDGDGKNPDHITCDVCGKCVPACSCPGGYGCTGEGAHAGPPPDVDMLKRFYLSALHIVGRQTDFDTPMLLVVSRACEIAERLWEKYDKHAREITSQARSSGR